MASNEQEGGRNPGQSAWGQSQADRPQGGAASQQQSFQDVHRASGYAAAGGRSGQGAQAGGAQGGWDSNERQRSSNSMQMGQRGSQPGSQQGSPQGSQQGLQRRSGYSQASSPDPWSQFSMLTDAPLGGTGPFSLMRRMTQDMDRLFDALGMGFGMGGLNAGASSSAAGGSAFPGAGQQQRSLTGGGQRGSQASLWSPHVEVRERQGNLVVMADLPGIKKEDIDLEVQHDQLVIQGHRHQESSEHEGGFYRSERSYGSFYRTIPLPEGIDGESARASFRDGVLEIEFRMPEKNRGRRLEIGDGGSSAVSTGSAGGVRQGAGGMGGASQLGSGMGAANQGGTGLGGESQATGATGGSSMASAGAGSTGSMTESGHGGAPGAGASAASTQRDPSDSGQQRNGSDGAGRS